MIKEAGKSKICRDGEQQAADQGRTDERGK